MVCTVFLPKMDRAKYFLWGLVVLTSLWSFRGLFGGESSDTTGGGMKGRQILSDVSSAAEVVECGYSDELSTTFTATQGAENYVSLINSTQQEAQEIMKQAGKIAPQPLQHRVGSPDAPWQIVLIPHDEEQKIIIRGYGEDLKKPLIEQVVLCK